MTFFLTCWSSSNPQNFVQAFLNISGPANSNKSTLIMPSRKKNFPIDLQHRKKICCSVSDAIDSYFILGNKGVDRGYPFQKQVIMSEVTFAR